jgi:flagellar hook-associated protein 1
MSGLLSDLGISAKALDAQSKGVELAGRNLANVTNPDYARQRVILGTRGIEQTRLGPMSMGVEALGVQQLRDQFLDAQTTREVSQTQLLQAQQDNLLKAQADLGEQVDSTSNAASLGDTTHSTNGISAALNDFFNAFENLSANPTDTGAKQLLLQKADILASKLNTSDSRLANLQSDITAQVNSDVATVNGLLGNIANLNGQIEQFEVQQPNSAVDLRDQRQADLEQLAKYLDFTTKSGPNGQIQIIAHDTASNEVVLVDKTSVLGSGLIFNGTQFSGGANGATLALQGGSLRGDVLVRDGTIQQLRDSLKNTASQLTSAVNKAYNPTGATGDFFQSGALSSGIIALDPSLSLSTLKTSDTGDAGANELALAVAQVADQKFSTAGGDLIDGTLGGSYDATVSGLGQSVATVQSKLSDQQTVERMVRAQRDQVSGVSQDEEMTDLMKYQRAFQAQARVISVVDSLLDTVVNGLFGQPL